MRKTLITLALIILAISLSGCGNQPQSGEGLTSDEKVQLAQCLTEKGVKMYGAIWCAHCNNQKKEFGDAFEYINYIECDAATDLDGAKECMKAGIKGYPTWEFGDGTQKPGEIKLTELAKIAGC